MHRALIYELATGRFIQQREDALHRLSQVWATGEAAASYHS